MAPVHWNVLNLYKSPLDHSDNNSTSVGTIQLSYNYCAKTSLHPPSPVTLLYPASQLMYCGDYEITQASKRIQTRALSIERTWLSTTLKNWYTLKSSHDTIQNKYHQSKLPKVTLTEYKKLHKFLRLE